MSVLPSGDQLAFPPGPSDAFEGREVMILDFDQENPRPLISAEGSGFFVNAFPDERHL